MISNAFEKLDWTLRNISDYGSAEDPRVRAAVETRQKILEAVIPDGNYLGSSNIARGIHWQSAVFALADGDYDKAVSELKKAKKYTLEMDRCMNSPKQLYTAILLDHYGYDYSNERPFDKSLTEYWIEEAAEVFAPLKGRPDFDELLTTP
jgi:tetratricopeptide (TPR) repeat protein